MMQQNLALFILTGIQKQLLMRVLFTIYLSQSIVPLYQTSKNFLEKVSAGLFIHFNDTINISKYNPFSCSIADTNHQ